MKEVGFLTVKTGFITNLPCYPSSVLKRFYHRKQSQRQQGARRCRGTGTCKRDSTSGGRMPTPLTTIFRAVCHPMFMFGFADNWKRRWPLVFVGVVAFSKLYEWFLEPIVTLNIERSAEARKLDTLLVEGDKWAGPLLISLVQTLYALFSRLVEFFASDTFFGITIGALVFAFWDPIARYVYSPTQQKRRIRAESWLKLSEDIIQLMQANEANRWRSSREDFRFQSMLSHKNLTEPERDRLWDEHNQHIQLESERNRQAVQKLQRTFNWG
jgi:hypothetical protein